MTEIQRKIYLAEGDAPNGYQSTPIGFLPSDWEYAKLSDLSLELTETAGEKKYETVSISAGIGFVNQAKKFGKELSGKQYEKYIVLHKGDFSYNKGNSNRYPQGCIYRLNDREEAAVPNVFESFRIVKGCPEYYEQLFICGFLNHQLFRLINHGVRDDGLLNLTGTDFYSCLLPVPPLREQERIVDILSTCDRTIDYYEEKVEQYRKLKKYLLEKMFPRKGAAVPEIRFPGFTDTWEQRKVSEVCSISTGKSNTQDKIDDGVYPFYVRSPIIERSNRYLYDEEAVLTVGDGVGTGKVFHYVNGKYDLHQRVYRLFGFSEDTDAKFFYHWFSENFYDRVMSMTAKTSVDSVRLEMIADMEMTAPSYAEQRKIANYLDSIDNLITLHQREADAWKTKKKALAQLLLTGIVRV